MGGNISEMHYLNGIWNVKSISMGTIEMNNLVRWNGILTHDDKYGIEVSIFCGELKRIKQP